MILDKLSWDIENGNKDLFWKDYWRGYATLDTLPISPRIKETLENVWDMHLKDYIEYPNGDTALGWKWKSLDNTPLIKGEK